MNGSVWVASYVMLWLVVGALVVVVVALLRQIGVLHARLAPRGVHFAGEGPPINSPAPLVGPVGYSHRITLVAFTKVGCEICHALAPSMVALREQYRDMRYVEINHDLGPNGAELFRAFNVRSTPYFVAVDSTGMVRGRGVGNSLEQVEELIEETLRTYDALSTSGHATAVATEAARSQESR